MGASRKTSDFDSTKSNVTEAKGSAQPVASLFSVAKMDCPSEERVIRLALDSVSGVTALDFDLDRRELRVVHNGSVEPIAQRLEGLALGARLVSTSAANDAIPRDATTPSTTAGQEKSVLITLIAINAVMFVVEIVTGWLGESTGLLADSLDMFADAAVYGLALYAVGGDVRHKLTAAKLAGWLQALLALGALFEVLRRSIFGSEPEAPVMMGIALMALAANVACLWLISRHRHGGAHMRASWIFSTNDVLANLGVIMAGALVAWTGSRYPDLVIGALVALLVLNGARRILRLGG